MQKLPVICPSCTSGLAVSQLKCPTCETVISGNYTLPVLLKLSAEEQEFMFEFFMSSGSLKKMAAQMGKSYPTVRNKLDDMIQKLNDLKAQGE
ncbi:MAG: DUF2089 family protein [Flavobacteriales bacterium]